MLLLYGFQDVVNECFDLQATTYAILTPYVTVLSGSIPVFSSRAFAVDQKSIFAEPLGRLHLCSCHGKEPSPAARHTFISTHTNSKQTAVHMSACQQHSNMLVAFAGTTLTGCHTWLTHAIA